MSPARNFFLAICFCLAACGGGGSSSDDGQISRLKRDMPHISFGRNPASPGYASATRALRQSLASETFIKLSADERKFVLETANENIIKDAHPLAFQPIKDTNAETAWRMGWTGRWLSRSEFSTTLLMLVEEARHMVEPLPPLPYRLPLKCVLPEDN